MVAGEPFAQRLDDRNAAADRGLEVERAAVFLGELRRARTPCLASSALLAVTTGLPGSSAASTAACAGSPAPPISSTKHVDVRIVRQRDRIVEPARCRQIEAALLGLASARDTATTANGAAAARRQRSRAAAR